MRTRDLLSLATRMFKTRPLRTFLTILGVGVGIGAVLFLVSFGYGLQKVILDRISSADALLTLELTPGPSDTLKLTDAAIQGIGKLPHVQEVSRQKNLPAQISTASLTSNGAVFAIDPTFLRLQGVTAAKGGLFTESNRREVVLSSAAAKLLNFTLDGAVGQQLRIKIIVPKEENPSGHETEVPQPDAFTIVGVVDDENVNYVYARLSDISGIAVDHYDQVKVKTQSSEFMEPLRAEIIRRGYVVSTISDTIDQAKKVFQAIQIMLSLFGLVALFVSAIGMFNTMTIALLERTSEIGIMRSIGITQKDVQWLFLLESMLMSFLGGVGGITMGMAGGQIVNFLINQLARRFGGPILQLFYTPLWFIVVIMVFSTLIGLLTGLYPSMRASRLNPLDALRYK